MLTYKTRRAGTAAGLDDVDTSGRRSGSRIEFVIVGGLLLLQFFLW